MSSCRTSIASLQCRSVSRVRICFSKAQPDSQRQPHAQISSPATAQLGIQRRGHTIDAPDAVRIVSLATAGLMVCAGAAQAGEGVPAQFTGLLNDWLVRTRLHSRSIQTAHLKVFFAFAGHLLRRGGYMPLRHVEMLMCLNHTTPCLVSHGSTSSHFVKPQ